MAKQTLKEMVRELGTAVLSDNVKHRGDDVVMDYKTWNKIMEVAVKLEFYIGKEN